MLSYACIRNVNHILIGWLAQLCGFILSFSFGVGGCGWVESVEWEYEYILSIERNTGGRLNIAEISH